MAALFFKPALGLVLVTLRAGAIATGVKRKHILLAVIALVDVASKERRAAGGNISEGLLLDRAQGFTELFAIRRAMEAEDIGHLQHEDRKSEVFHEVIERLDQGRFQLRRQMRVNLSRTGAVMSEIFLNDAQVEACFQ